MNQSGSEILEGAHDKILSKLTGVKNRVTEIMGSPELQQATMDKLTNLTASLDTLYDEIRRVMKHHGQLQQQHDQQHDQANNQKQVQQNHGMMKNEWNVCGANKAKIFSHL